MVNKISYNLYEWIGYLGDKQSNFHCNIYNKVSLYYDAIMNTCIVCVIHDNDFAPSSFLKS